MDYVLFTNAKMKDEVYKMLDTMMKNKSELVGSGADPERPRRRTHCIASTISPTIPAP